MHLYMPSITKRCRHNSGGSSPKRTSGEMMNTLKPSSASMPTAIPAVPGLLVQLKATAPTDVPVLSQKSKERTLT